MISLFSDDRSFPLPLLSRFLFDLAASKTPKKAKNQQKPKTLFDPYWVSLADWRMVKCVTQRKQLSSFVPQIVPPTYHRDHMPIINYTNLEICVKKFAVSFTNLAFVTKSFLKFAIYHE